MRWLVAMLCALHLALSGLAQQRSATVRLDDGTVLQGIVLELDLSMLRLDVGGKEHRIPASRVASFAMAGAAPGANVRPLPPVRPADEWDGEVLDADCLPHDLRNRSLWRQRIDALDEAYPWLAPATPPQWISLGLMLFACLSLIVHVSVQVTGAERNDFPRSIALALWYLVSGALQVALVPARDVAVAIMLLANTALSLFGLRSLFGLSRPSTAIALAVQLGLAAVGFGVLQLVDAVLASMGANPS